MQFLKISLKSVGRILTRFSCRRNLTDWWGLRGSGCHLECCSQKSSMWCRVFRGMVGSVGVTGEWVAWNEKSHNPPGEAPVHRYCNGKCPTCRGAVKVQKVSTGPQKDLEHNWIGLVWGANVIGAPNLQQHLSWAVLFAMRGFLCVFRREKFFIISSPLQNKF